MGSGLATAPTAQILILRSGRKRVAIIASCATFWTMDAEIIERVREIIRELDLTNRQFADAIGLDEDKLSKTLNARRRLTPLELARIAELSGRTTDWILSGVEPRRMGIAARARSSVDDLQSIGGDLARKYTNAHDVLVELGRARELPPLPQIAQTGRFVREGQAMAEWASGRLPEGALLDDSSLFIATLEEAFGVEIASVTELPHGCDGLSFQDSTFRLILLATTANWTRKRFTLAHELGHILWGDAHDRILTEVVSPGAETDYAEKRANAFAGAFLMPEVSVSEFVAERPIDEHLFHELVMRYRVSPSAMAARLAQLGLLTKSDAQSLRSFGTQQSASALDRVAESMSESTLASTRMPPQTMTLAFIAAYLAGEVGTRPLVSITGVSDKDLRAIFNEATPAPVAVDTLDATSDDDAQLVFTP